MESRKLVRLSLLETGGGQRSWRGDEGENGQREEGVSTGQFLHLRPGPLFFERYSTRRRRRCRCHRRRLRPFLKRFLKKRGGGGGGGEGPTFFYFILFYFLSLSPSFPFSLSLS